MRSTVPITPQTGSSKGQMAPGATLSEQEIRRMILRGEVNKADLTLQEREKYREELKKARRY